MTIVRTTARCAEVVERTLYGLADESDVVEWDVSTSMVEVSCGNSDEDDEYTHSEQVLCLWISVAAPETESRSVCSLMLPVQIACNERIHDAVTNAWHELAFTRRAYELECDPGMSGLVERLDDGLDPGS